MRRVVFALLGLGIACLLTSTDALARNDRHGPGNERDRVHPHGRGHGHEWGRGHGHGRGQGRGDRHGPGHDRHGEDGDDAEDSGNGIAAPVALGLPWSGWQCRGLPGGALECILPPVAPPVGLTAPNPSPDAMASLPRAWPGQPPELPDPGAEGRIISPSPVPQQIPDTPIAPASPPTAAYVIQSPFDEQEFAPYARTGSSRISGEAYARLPGGNVVLAAGSEVVLVPDTPYTRELLEPARSGQYSRVANLDPRYFRYRRKVTADDNGHFRFTSVPAGSYIVQVGVRIPQTGQPNSPGMIFLHETVTVADDAGTTVVMSNRPAAQAQR